MFFVCNLCCWVFWVQKIISLTIFLFCWCFLKGLYLRFVSFCWCFGLYLTFSRVKWVFSLRISILVYRTFYKTRLYFQFFGCIPNTLFILFRARRFDRFFNSNTHWNWPACELKLIYIEPWFLPYYLRVVIHSYPLSFIETVSRTPAVGFSLCDILCIC